MKKKYAKPIAILATIFFPVTILFIFGMFLGAMLCLGLSTMYKTLCSFLEEVL